MKPRVLTMDTPLDRLHPPATFEELTSMLLQHKRVQWMENTGQTFMPKEVREDIEDKAKVAALYLLKNGDPDIREAVLHSVEVRKVHAVLIRALKLLVALLVVGSILAGSHWLAGSLSP